jgi:hypothetical protein
MSHCGNCSHGCCCYCTRVGCGFCNNKKCGDPKYYKKHYVCFTCKIGWKHSEKKAPNDPDDAFWDSDPSRCSKCCKNGTEVGKCIRIPATNKHKDWQVLEQVHFSIKSPEFMTASIKTIAHEITKNGFVKFLDELVHKPKSNFWLPTKMYEFANWKEEMIKKRDTSLCVIKYINRYG